MEGDEKVKGKSAEEHGKSGEKGKSGEAPGQQKTYSVSNPATGETRTVTQAQWRTEKLGKAGFIKPAELVEEPETPDVGLEGGTL